MKKNLIANFKNIVAAMMLITGIFMSCGIGTADAQEPDFQEFQLVPTNGAFDWEFFSFDNKYFLAVVNAFDGKTVNLSSKIYQWNGMEFVEIQSFPTNYGFDWESFSIGSDHFLAVANNFDSADYNINSKIYKWNGERFAEFQTIPTVGASDWEFFTIGENRYLAVANQRDDNTYSVNSKIYKWDGERFAEFQTIPSVGAIACKFFIINDTKYLAIANSFNGSTYINTSKLYKWEESEFVEIQSFSTNGATDIEFFTIEGKNYLAIANWRIDKTYEINSEIYRWDGQNFIEFQSIKTSGANDWEFFSIGKNHYLAVANWRNNLQNFNTDSKIYRWNGINFSEFDAFPTHGAMDCCYFNIDGYDYIAVANMHNNTDANINSVIYKNTVYPPVMYGETFSLDENSAAGTVIGRMTAKDTDSAALTYSIAAGNTGEVFAINSLSGQITVNDASLLDYETSAAYLLTVQVSDGVYTDAATVTVNVNDVNEAPVAENQTFSVKEDSPEGTLVGKVAAVDPESDPMTYRITAGNTNTVFAISGTSGQITVSNAGNLGTGSYALEIEVSDGDKSDTAIIIVNVSVIDKSPTVNSATFSIAENSANATAVGTVSAGDPNGDPLTYSILSGNTDKAFAVNSSNGQITVADSGQLDYESSPVFLLTVQASDGVYSGSAIITVNLKDVNDPPVINDQTFSVDENSPGGIPLGIVFAIDQDSDALTYSITAGNTENIFVLNANTGELSLSNTAQLDYETKTAYSLTIRVLDSASSDTATVTVNVKDKNEQHPVVEDQSFSIAENSADGSVVGKVTASDPDSETLFYSILSGNTGNAFAVNPANGEITVADFSKLNYEVCSVYKVTVQVSDGPGSDTLIDTAVITLNITDMNEAPVINAQVFSVNEGSPAGTAVGAVSADDPDGDSLTYSITAGNTGTAFAINSGTGQISVKNSAQLSYDNGTSYALTVQVSDGASSGTATVTVNVNYVNKSPVMENQRFSVNENSPEGAVVGTVKASDPDAGDKLTFSILSGNTDSTFKIDGSTGNLTVAASDKLNYEASVRYVLTVQVSDGVYTDSGTVTINVLNVNEPPVINDQAFSVRENSEKGTAVGKLAASDPDADTVVMFSMLSGNTNNAFALSVGGEITVFNAAFLDYETAPLHELTVQVSDGPGSDALTDTAKISISLTDAAETPVMDDQTFSVDESSPNGTLVGQVRAADPDSGELNFSIVDGNTDSTFAINSGTGRITVADRSGLNYQKTTVYRLTVSVSDGPGDDTNSDTALVTISVNYVNQSPVLADQTFSVPENSTGVWVGKISAADPNSDKLTYSIESGNEGNAFAIDSGTGDMTVNDGSRLDHETAGKYLLTVEASDGTYRDAGIITVFVSDVNETPAAKDQIFSADENSAEGILIGAVAASDPDGDPLTYTIVSGNSSNAFALSSQTGEMTVKDGARLDYETLPVMELLIEVSDGVNTVTVRVTVNVNDVSVPGDTDDNGIVNLRDALLIFKPLVKLPADIKKYSGEVNGDKKFGTEELIYILKKLRNEK